MQKIKALLIALLFSATVQAQTAAQEQSSVQQTVENMFATLTTADTAALKTFVTVMCVFMSTDKSGRLIR